MNSQSITFTCDNVVFDRDMFYLLAYGHKEKICKYFLKYPFGISLLRGLSEQDLLFLMPNNAKRRLGFPMTRVAKRGRKARDFKRIRKKVLAYHNVFAWVEAKVPVRINEEFDKTLGNMADVGGIANGNQNQVSQ